MTISVLIKDGRVTISIPEMDSGPSLARSQRSVTLASLSSASSGRARALSTSSRESEDLGLDQHDNKRAKVSNEAPEKPKNDRCHTCQMRDIECKYKGIMPCEACKELETECDRYPCGLRETWETQEEKLQHRIKVIVNELELTRDAVDALQTNFDNFRNSDETKCDNIDDLDSRLKRLEDAVKNKQKLINNLETKVGHLERSFDKRVEDMGFAFDRRLELISKEHNKIVEKRVQEIKLELTKRIEMIEQEQSKLSAPRQASRVVSSTATGTDSLANPKSTTSRSSTFAPAYYPATYYDYAYGYGLDYGSGPSKPAAGPPSYSHNTYGAGTMNQGFYY